MKNKRPSVRREYSSFVARNDGEVLPFLFYSIIFELIQGEMAYVKDLENIEHVGLKHICWFSY